MLAKENKLYDCVIVGGGLAGLCLSIQLARMGHSVALVEKNKYPFHKVCGEYISMESFNFLQNLGVPLAKMNLPFINSLNITSHQGFKISSSLAMGGFGISRHTLDHQLACIAKKSGVMVLENCNATNVTLENNIYRIETALTILKAKIVCGSYGKIEPSFIDRTENKKKGDYIAVKYHIKTQFADNLIELHNFSDGYCGISKVDNHTVCLCYLTTTKNLRKSNNDIKVLEEKFLKKNPFLNKYFSDSEFLFEKPIAISKISFAKKQIYKNDVILLGDAAGAIAPLCGNGMSIAMRTSKIISRYLSLYLQNKISKTELLDSYRKEWNENFALRIKTGYYLQMLFGRQLTTLLSLKILKYFPGLFRKLIALTHGNEF
jgi:flavin-dependent dehydrogenase